MDSENRYTLSSPKKARSSSALGINVASTERRPRLLDTLRKPTLASSEGETDSENEASTSEDDVSAPELISKLPTALISQPATSQPEEDEESDGGAAYQRMKKRLAASNKSTQDGKPQNDTPLPISIKSGDEENAVPERSTARKSVEEPSKLGSRTSSPSRNVQSPPSSPGLFVSPHPSPSTKRSSRSTPEADSDSGKPSRCLHDTDLQERIQRIRAKRLAKQREGGAEELRPSALARREEERDSDGDADIENDAQLTQHAKPTRKAGKKAMEAMARDQQRISRNMQLTHQAKTKKRYTTKDLFTRLGFQLPNDPAETSPLPDSSSVPASSDMQANQAQDTPPTSPPRQEGIADKNESSIATAVPIATGTVHNQHLPLPSRLDKAGPIVVSNVQVDTRSLPDDGMVELNDSEDELEVTHIKKRFPVFDRMPEKKQHESAPLLHLRSLAQLVKPPQTKKSKQGQVTLAEMEWSLAQKARQQKNRQREERIAELKQRGHIIETEEEREKHQLEIEDMVAQFERQRQEDLSLAKLERDEAKKNGEIIDDLPSSDESDGDYVGSGEDGMNENEDDVEAPTELELSGSEEETESVEVQEGDLADDCSDTSDMEVDEHDQAKIAARLERTKKDTDLEKDSTNQRKQTARSRRYRVVDDEDESDKETPDPVLLAQQVTQDNDMAAFGFNHMNSGLGLTQMFAGTMASLESGSAVQPEAEQDSLDFLRNLPDTQPAANFTQVPESTVPNSQSLAWPQEESESSPNVQFSLGISQVIKTSPVLCRTQLEDFEPTQDAGFSFSRSPAGLVPPPSTVDTIMMPIAELPIKLRKSKLHRGRREATVELSDVEGDVAMAQDQMSEDDIQRPPKPSDAFIRMKKAAKKQKAQEEFNKKRSLAKEAVMEQAEESEDEYAGLGGASDDDEGEEEQELKDMIDHDDVKVDERRIAAFYADKAKKEDEKNIADLYKKIQTGGLRRQAGGRNGFDMSDSEDEEEQRQRKKQEAFQKMSRALLKDERVKQLADDPKKKPFLNTLADFADEGDYDFLDLPAELGIARQEELQGELHPDKNTQEDDVIPDSQTVDTSVASGANSPSKRKCTDSQKENRPPPHLRRTAATDKTMRKPMTLADVQNSVSELLEDARVIVPDSQYSDDEDEDYAAPNASSRKVIVDRLSLSRTPTAESAADSNWAFHAPSRTMAARGFRAPSLIRRATSNMSTTSEGRGSSGTNTPVEGGVRRGGTGKSNIHAQAREAERRALLEKKEGKRRAALRKKVEGGRRRAEGMRSVLGDLGGGFE